MTDPISFDSITPRFGLPLLFAGQAQKEIFVNEALARIDGLLHCAVEAEAAAPPAVIEDGQVWLVAALATGEWSDHSGQIAFREGGQWLFAVPRDGLTLLDRSTGQVVRRISGQWRRPLVPAAAIGGTVVDSEARAALSALVNALQECGVLPA